jgi:predicted transglutaminase-like cysteine proteinase
MITVSIQPFQFKKVFVLIAGLVCLSSVSSFAHSALFLGVASTPYDHQMSRIQSVLLSKSSVHKRDVSLAIVNQWIGDLRSIPYGFSQEWKTPEEVQTSPAADCKGKAVALYQRMHSYGAQNVRLVIGKRTSTSAKTHAWLEWNTDSGTYVLDPTINWAACRTAEIGANAYVPLYAYAGTQKYRAAAASLYAKN